MRPRIRRVHVPAPERRDGRGSAADSRALIERLPCGRSHLCDQFTRASTSIVLNLAERAGKHSKPDKRRYYLTARGSATESAALLDICWMLAARERFAAHRTDATDLDDSNRLETGTGLERGRVTSFGCSSRGRPGRTSRKGSMWPSRYVALLSDCVERSLSARKGGVLGRARSLRALANHRKRSIDLALRASCLLLCDRTSYASSELARASMSCWLDSAPRPPHRAVPKPQQVRCRGLRNLLKSDAEQTSARAAGPPFLRGMSRVAPESNDRLGPRARSNLAEREATAQYGGRPVLIRREPWLTSRRTPHGAPSTSTPQRARSSCWSGGSTSGSWSRRERSGGRQQRGKRFTGDRAAPSGMPGATGRCSKWRAARSYQALPRA